MVVARLVESQSNGSRMVFESMSNRSCNQRFLACSECKNFSNYKFQYQSSSQ